MENKIPSVEDFKRMENNLTLFRDDMSGYAQFIDRNIKQSNKIIEIDKKVHELKNKLLKWKGIVDVLSTKVGKEASYENSRKLNQLFKEIEEAYQELKQTKDIEKK